MGAECQDAVTGKVGLPQMAGREAFVRTIGAPSVTERRVALFDAEADGVAFSSGVLTAAAGNLLTFDTFPTGAKYCEVAYHLTDGGIAYIPFVLVTLNAGTDATAVSRFTMTPTQENGTGSTDTRGDIISQTFPIQSYDVRGTNETIDRIDLMGIASNLVGTTDVMVTIKVKL